MRARRHERDLTTVRTSSGDAAISISVYIICGKHRGNSEGVYIKPFYMMDRITARRLQKLGEDS